LDSRFCRWRRCEEIKSNNRQYPFINFSLQIKQSNHDVAVLNKIKENFDSGYLKPKYDINNLKTSNDENSLI